MINVIQRAAAVAVLATAFMANVSAGNAAMGDGYDNPTQGDVPCVVLNKYGTRRHSSGQYRATVAVENVCGRTMEVQVCMVFREPVDDQKALCLEDLVRPFSGWNPGYVMAPSKLSGVQLSWRQIGAM